MTNKTPRPSIDHGLLSPSGKMPKSARKAALKREYDKLFPKDEFPNGTGHALPKQPTDKEYLLKQATELRDLATRGMKTRVYNKKADELEAQAELLS